VAPNKLDTVHGCTYTRKQLQRSHSKRMHTEQSRQHRTSRFVAVTAEHAVSNGVNDNVVDHLRDAFNTFRVHTSHRAQSQQPTGRVDAPTTAIGVRNGRESPRQHAWQVDTNRKHAKSKTRLHTRDVTDLIATIAISVRDLRGAHRYQKRISRGTCCYSCRARF